MNPAHFGGLNPDRRLLLTLAVRLAQSTPTTALLRRRPELTGDTEEDLDRTTVYPGPRESSEATDTIEEAGRCWVDHLAHPRLIPRRSRTSRPAQPTPQALPVGRRGSEPSITPEQRAVEWSETESTIRRTRPRTEPPPVPRAASRSSTQKPTLPAARKPTSPPPFALARGTVPSLPTSSPDFHDEARTVRRRR